MAAAFYAKADRDKTVFLGISQLQPLHLPLLRQIKKKTYQNIFSLILDRNTGLISGGSQNE